MIDLMIMMNVSLWHTSYGINDWLYDGKRVVMAHFVWYQRLALRWQTCRYGTLRMVSTTGSMMANGSLWHTSYGINDWLYDGKRVVMAHFVWYQRLAL